jgi:hypothetical protein
VGEDGERVDEVEALVGERERRCDRVHLEAAEREVVAAPFDRRRAHVASRDVAVEVLEVARDAPAAAAEVEHRAGIAEVRCDRVVAGATAAEEPVRVRCHRDAHHQPARGQREPVVRRDAATAQREQPFVGAERRADDPEPFEDAQQATLHGYS